jgi:AAA15 family ATPase/GTPase
MLWFGVKNLRRLKDVPPLQIKPITILVGRNSSGKSSFLRAFPLVRQSIMTRTSSPILWYGDFVDFGSFEGAVWDNKIENPISLTFGLDEIRYIPRAVLFYDEDYIDNSIYIYRDIRVEVSVRSADDRTYISYLRFSYNNGNNIFELHADDRADISSLTFNGTDILSLFTRYKIGISQGTIFPEMNVAIKDATEAFRFYPEPAISS